MTRSNRVNYDARTGDRIQFEQSGKTRTVIVLDSLPFGLVIAGEKTGKVESVYYSDIQKLDAVYTGLVTDGDAVLGNGGVR